MEMGTQIFFTVSCGLQLLSQFPVVLGDSALERLQGILPSSLYHVPCLETQQNGHLGDHCRGGEPCPQQSKETLRMT